MDQKLRTERRKLADLKAAEYNPRKALTPDDAEYQKIRRSIEEFGYVDPIIINEDGTIIGGHQRATVLKDLGYQEVDVVVVALDKQREKALNIALNKITGEWDEVKLKDLLLDLDLGDYDISLTGFEQNDLTELVDKLAIEPEAVDDDFNEDEALEQAEAEPVTKLGDVWLLGRHRLMCGDSTSQDDMAVLMNGEIADLVVTDPPYNVNYGDKAEMLDEYLPAKGHRNINHIKKNYTYDVTGAKYQDTGISLPKVLNDDGSTQKTGIFYPHKYQTVPGFGVVPVHPCKGSTSTGGCDGLWQNVEIVAVALRFGACGDGTGDGLRSLSVSNTAGNADWDLGAAVLLLPPVGVAA